ncbi:MAG: hypothetical protein JKX83_07200 [Pseudomonadales bacterium]|nr:hypothetical protein [Pseudomonadales bacterium]
MSSINQHVRLEPKEALNPNLSFCTAKPKALRVWVEELPITNIPKASKLLHDAIIEVHLLITPPENRFQLLEVLAEPIRAICIVLTKNYLGQTLVLTQKTMNAAQLSQALQSELASAYERVIVDTKDTRTGITRKPPAYTATAIYRCIAELLQLQLRCHLLYSALPDYYWLKLNTLYLYAEQLNYLSITQQTPGFEHFSSLTPADLYKVSILLEVAKPEQLRQQEITHLKEVLPLWAKKVKLSPYSPEVAQSFIVDIHSNQPPQYNKVPNDEDVHHVRVLDTSELVTALRDYIYSRSSDTDIANNPDPDFAVPEQFGPDLMTKLCNAWGERGKRLLQRSDVNMHVQACTGLTSIHYFASGCVDFATAPKNTHVIYTEKGDFKSDPGTSYSTELAIEEMDVWSNTFNSEPTETEEKSFQAEINNTKEFKLETINASAGGYCLRWDPEITEKIQAGDLIGLQTGSSKPWGLGVVRWIRQDQSALFNIGVEFLSAMIRCCAIQAVGASDIGTDPLRALLIPGSKKSGRPPTIITYHRPFNSGSKAKIIIGDKSTQVRLKQSINSSYAFNQFTYMVLAENKPAMGASSEQVDGQQSNIDALYENL